MINKVYLIDNMEFMHDKPDNYYELAIVDPPYGIFTKDQRTGFVKKTICAKQSKKIEKWDNRPTKEYFKELKRVSKNQIIWGMQYFTTDLKDFSQLIVWNKLTGNNFFTDGEAAYCSIKGTLRIFNHQWCGAFKDSERQEKAIHPTQKPVALYKWLLTNYAKPNDKIFDSHVGSGSSRIACYELGFDFEGCELDKDYWQAQEKRFELEKAKIDNRFYIPQEENNLF